MDGYRGGDGLSAGGDTVCQESDGVGLTAFGSVFQSQGGRQVGGVFFLIGVYNRRKITTGQIQIYRGIHTVIRQEFRRDGVVQAVQKLTGDGFDNGTARSIFGIEEGVQCQITV